jgi:hypothetical protein
VIGDPSNPYRLFLAIAGVGVLVSDDDGETWRTITTGLPSLDIRGITVSSAGVFLATGSGLFRLDRATAVVEAPETTGSPERPTLFPNAPNPFNGTTTIRYAVPPVGQRSSSGGSTVRLAIYNVQGQAVRILVEGVQLPGSYGVVWDGRDDRGQPVASGVYVCRLAVEVFAQTRKLVVLR